MGPVSSWADWQELVRNGWFVHLQLGYGPLTPPYGDEIDSGLWLEQADTLGSVQKGRWAVNSRKKIVNNELLHKHLRSYAKWRENNADRYAKDMGERKERKTYYRGWTRERLLGMKPEDLAEYMSKLWAMQIWGNKQYVVDKVISDNGMQTVRVALADLIWGAGPVGPRWDAFRKKIKGVGPAMMSELLCSTHSNECMVWNRRALVGFHYLGVRDLPRYSYQLTGHRYEELSATAKEIGAEMAEFGEMDHDLLAVDYFIWEELQVEDNLSAISFEGDGGSEAIAKADKETSQFIHNEVRDKIEQIGIWLGFDGRTEIKVSAGSKVDATWEATIGNMGRVIYVFEVQTKGAIDSLLINLQKSLNNPAVQGVIAVSDKAQLEKIKSHAAGLSGLHDKLKYWDYEEVLRVHAALEEAYESINALQLVPDSFVK